MGYPFKQAKNYTPTSGRTIRVIVIHDMEAPERSDIAEAVANYFAGANAPRASAHYNIDNDSIVQSVHDKDVAWAAPHVNHDGLHFEHGGYASQTRGEWLDPYGVAMLEQSAKLCADKCRQYGIPVRWLTPSELAAGQKGITSHWNATLGYKYYGGHTDPGAGFPVDYYLERVQHYMGGGSVPSKPKPVPASVTLVKRGDKGAKVREIQDILKAGGLYKGEIDGDFGPKTEAAVKEWQRLLKLDDDGVWGPKTEAATKAFMDYLATVKPTPSKPKPKPKPKPTPKPSGTLLRRGSEGKAVEDLQERLNGLGADLKVDGDFGPATEFAVRQFQTFWGIDVDGVVGDQTYDKLAEVEALVKAKKPVAKERPTIRKGHRGAYVREIQRFLKIKVDGKFGPETERAVKNFQGFWKLDQDGIVGPKTWGTIDWLKSL